MAKQRTATSQRRPRSRMRQPPVTRKEMNAVVRRLDAVERRVEDLRAIAISLLRDSMRSAELRKSATSPGADIQKAATMARLLGESPGT
jgi:hypothetical protein